MSSPLRLVPGADDFLTDRFDPLEHTVEIPRYRPLPPVPTPVRRQRARLRSELAACVLLLVVLVAVVATAIAAGIPALVNR